MCGERKTLLRNVCLVYNIYTMSFIRRIKKGNGVYLAEVENQWIEGKCVQKHIRYVGKEADGKTVLSASMSDIEVESVKLYGPLLVLNFLAEEIGLSKLLGEYGEEILSMVYAHCLDYKSINQMPRWFERTDLSMLLNLGGLTEKRLLNALDSLERQDQDRLQRNIFEAVQKRYQLNVSGVLYDVTNTYLFGKKCPFGKQGHDKERVAGRPLIQIGLGVTDDYGIPLFHKVFDGNVHDARTLRACMESFKRFEVKSGVVIYYDRGIVSAQNLRDIQQLRWHTICGLPLKGNLKDLVRTLMKQSQFIDLANRIRLSKTVLYAVTTSHEIGKVKGTLVLCYNQDQQRCLRESRYDELLNAQTLLRENKTIKAVLEPYFDKKGNLIKNKVAAAEEFDGYSCVFSAKRLSKEKIVRSYFDKDLVEQAFRSLKGVTRLRPIRHWLYNRVTAHIFICYLSYLLLSLLKYRVRKLEISAEEALQELDSMYKVYLKDSKKGFELSRVVALTKKQEAILRAISPRLLKV